jgi:hypothetical protein
MVIGYVGKAVYYLQRVNGSYRWNGLKDNAAVFKTKEHAEHAIQSTYSKIKPIIVII